MENVKDKTIALELELNIEELESRIAPDAETVNPLMKPFFGNNHQHPHPR